MRLAIGAGALAQDVGDLQRRSGGHAGWAAWATAQARALRGSSSRSNGDGVAEVLS